MQYEAQRQLLLEQKGIYQDIAILKERIAQKGVFNQTESDAKVLDYVNSQVKGLSETFADFRIGIAEGFFEQINSPFDVLSNKLDKLPPLVKGLAQSFIGLANDIVHAFSSKIILRLLGLDGGGIGSGNSGGNWFQKLLGGIGGFGGGANGNYTTPSFNPNASNPFSILQTGGGNIWQGLGAWQPNMNGGNSANPLAALFGGSSSGGSVWSGLGPWKPSSGSASGGSGIGLAGGLALGGAAAGIIGSLIGGRAGGFISNIGSGVATGAALGSFIPGIGTAIGAVIGGGVGFLASLFGGDPKRKADKKQLPQLNQGFTDAFTQFSQLIKDVKSLRIEGDSALAKGAEIRNSIASGFGLNWQSKKYKKESDKLIQAKLAAIDKQPDGLMAQLRRAVDSSNAANERQRRLLPEFASGNFFGRDDQAYDMRRGLIIGNQPGKDRHLELFADGELIANKEHQRRINALAGYDILA